jgi:hypothetical protein
MTSPWQEWKKKNIERQQSGAVSPVDFFNPDTEYASDELATHRYLMCSSCPSLIKATKQCKECGCFMNLKVKLASANCPLGKW